ncbi:uncharacterized protein (DUF934 family) [Chitinivorax tropicus]|uniref:Uncharacterized protein (DUF934 family) n=1 Tax=Chitinivorax tropicus TaxID=714531 RepID=A0A840MQV4_9PROT|nr:DUF934 domain-containing protein [Chitinivorax tropicus]MBB5018826.1 uncharacterized protein (DUF934 family) [Chitinivorax tropicus]
MPKLIKQRQIIDDHFVVLRKADDGSLPALPSQGDVIVPLASWRSERDQLLAREGAIGVWLAPDEEPADIADDLAHFAVIAIDFPAFTDGRGFSTARLLRERYGYQGELRAIGDVFKDTLFYLARCGFNAFAVRPDKNIDDALLALDDFSDSYQTGVDQPVPLFRRRVA